MRTKESIIKSLDAIVRKQVVALGYCEKCHSTENLVCAHHIGRANKRLRFDKRNLHSLCQPCHDYFHENVEEFYEWIIATRGEKLFQQLRSEARIVIKLPRSWYEGKLKELQT